MICKKGYQKGHAKIPGSGIKKGQKHGITFPKARLEIFASGKRPIDEIIKLIPSLEPKDQLKAWIELQSWIEPKPKETEVAISVESRDLIIEQFDKIPEDIILNLIKAPDDSDEAL